MVALNGDVAFHYFMFPTVLAAAHAIQRNFDLNSSACGNILNAGSSEEIRL
jgi:hypothetical protein